jgi:hypothetical protein
MQVQILAGVLGTHDALFWGSSGSSLVISLLICILVTSSHGIYLRGAREASS